MNDDDKKMRVAFGKRLRWMRRDKEITQEQLAVLLGCTGPYIVHLEQGMKKPSSGMARKIELELGISCTRPSFEFHYEEGE